MSVLIGIAIVLGSLLGILFLIGLIASYCFPSDGTFRGRLTKIFESIGVVVFNRFVHTSALYKLWGSHILSTDSLYINLGYWKDAKDMDEAGRNMAHMLGERARIGSGDHVLDVGFGFGDQDMYWMETSRPKRITGLNITGFQVDRARQRVEQKGLHDRIDLREGSATAIPFPGEHFDKIMALECAFHFDSREDFFGEAFRVMKTGGRLAVADIIPMDSPGWPRGHGLIARLIEPFRQGIWQMPTKNQYPGREYQKRLEAAGFENVSVTSIREHVFGPLRDKVRGIIRQPEMRKRLHPLYDNRLALAAYATFIAHGPPFAPMDYVIVTADRPASAPCDAVGVAGRVPV